jgi:hypothetical protein
MQVNNISASRTPAKVLKFPALLNSGLLPITVWAERGYVWFDDPNREKFQCLLPIEALERLVTIITDYSPRMAEAPKQFQVDKRKLLEFADEFKELVYEEAMKQLHGKHRKIRVQTPILWKLNKTLNF